MVSFRIRIIMDIQQHVEFGVMIPGLSQKEGLQYLKHAVEGRKYIDSIVKNLTGSNPGYEYKDLPKEEKEMIDRLDHHIKILHALYDIDREA